MVSVKAAMFGAWIPPNDKYQYEIASHTAKDISTHFRRKGGEVNPSKSILLLLTRGQCGQVVTFFVLVWIDSRIGWWIARRIFNPCLLSYVLRNDVQLLRCHKILSEWEYSAEESFAYRFGASVHGSSDLFVKGVQHPYRRLCCAPRGFQEVVIVDMLERSQQLEDVRSAFKI